MHVSNADSQLRIETIFYSFAMSDYEGTDSVPLRAFISSIFYVNLPKRLCSQSIDIAQQEGLIEWDDQRIGAIKLTARGLKLFIHLRDNFWDDDAVNLLFQKLIIDAETTSLRHQTSNRKIFAYAGDTCPATGKWKRLPDGKEQYIEQNELIPLPKYSSNGHAFNWTWISD